MSNVLKFPNAKRSLPKLDLDADKTKAASFVAFLIAWTYDFILVALSPQEMMVTL